MHNYYALVDQEYITMNAITAYGFTTNKILLFNPKKTMVDRLCNLFGSSTSEEVELVAIV